LKLGTCNPIQSVSFNHLKNSLCQTSGVSARGGPNDSRLEKNNQLAFDSSQLGRLKCFQALAPGQPG